MEESDCAIYTFVYGAKSALRKPVLIAIIHTEIALCMDVAIRTQMSGGNALGAIL